MNHRIVVRFAIPLCVLLSLASDGRAATRSGSLSIADRVAAQRALDEVAYRHQIGAKRPFEETAPDAALERKVRTYLKKSAALERFWGTPVTGAMLDAEIDRLARSSRDAGRLAEMYAALGNDPLLVRECLARPLLVDRLTRSFFDGDASLHTSRLVRGAPMHRTWDSWWAQVEPTLDESSVQVAAVPARALALPKTVAGGL
ncbi:MAG TPA: hypothetical protein VFQ07_15745, partial [Candidatus Polarisedimenticolia bacterium]|nr:hypothetical protein [Candidatus Polarisedimenticolia bacterium]